MQPKTKPETKDNLEASRENKKEILPEQKVSPIQEWDHVAFKLIQDILAPKGYKEVTSGKWRGLRIANAEQPGIVKSKVNQCQKVAAQMVRTFRGKMQKDIKGMKENFEFQARVWEGEMKELPFWAFRKKKELHDQIIICKAKAEILNGAFNRMDTITIK